MLLLAFARGFTAHVSSVLGAPWRCGVLTTQGGTAGIGLGRLVGRERDSTPQSGVEAPRLLKKEPPQNCIVVVVFGECRMCVKIHST